MRHGCPPLGTLRDRLQGAARAGRSAGLALSFASASAREISIAISIALTLTLGTPGASVAAPAATHAAALQMLTDADPQRRLAAVQRLAEVGTMADVARVARALHDASVPVRVAAVTALWTIWSRSGDAAIDHKLAQGTQLMSEGELGPALELFDQIVKGRPAFAEGWNKRATVLFLLGRNAESLLDCDEVLKRNPHHYGALSGMAQIHLRRGEVEQALQAYRRALEINPNLEGGTALLRLLEEAVRERRSAPGGRTT